MSNNLIFSIVGARPHFVKAAPFMEAMKISKYQVFTIHTGQHYDTKMSDVFFSDLNLPKPDINLGIGSGSHAKQTASVMTEVEKLIFKFKPIAVVVYGDTNTTLGSALAAAKQYVPVIHIEAGVRCGNRKMPEEINRGIIDSISDFLCCPSDLAVTNLHKEGIKKGVFNIGDFMYDTFLNAKQASADIKFDLTSLEIERGGYILSTLHREETTNSVKELCRILDTLGSLDIPVVIPMHPRTKSCLKKAGLSFKRSDLLKIIEPVGYLQMIYLLNHASLVITDSGGLQKEAYWSGKHCVTLLRETTWPETVEAGWNTLVGLDTISMRSAVTNFFDQKLKPNSKRTEIYGAPGAAKRMIKKLGWI